MITLTVNGEKHQFDIEPETPLLWVLRDEIGLTGTKFGCGVAQCGACTVHIDGVAMRSCSVPVGGVDGASIITIEGLSPDSMHPVQQAWLAEDVPQCGYCQSGQIMAVAAFLKTNPAPTDAAIDAGITNICRCGTCERLPPRGAPRRRSNEGLGRTIMDGNSLPSLSRRHFIVTGLTATGGLAVGIGASPNLAQAFTVAPTPWDDDGTVPNELDAWIAIDDPDDGAVLIRAISDQAMEAEASMSGAAAKCALPRN